MPLKAVLFDFNGVIINDEPIHQTLIEQILVEENLRPNPAEFREVCLGRSDRACLKELFSRRGRIATDAYLNELIQRKSQRYQEQLETLTPLPIYPGVEDFIYQLRTAGLPMGVVSGALRQEVELVLQRSKLISAFSVIVAGDDIRTSKPEPDGYLLAVEHLKDQLQDATLKPEDCLVIEDTPAGIEAAKRAGMAVVGVANSYPFHMMQRQANWTVDYLTELELERIRCVFQGTGERELAAQVS
ncbi:MAG: HAD family phosphatase [Elainellaceae cyanobacterium]